MLSYKDLDFSLLDEQEQWEKQLVIERAFEIIGEITKRLYLSTFIEKYPQVPWTKMAQNRDFIAHQYEKIQVKILLKTIREDLPPTISMLKEIL